MIRKALLRNRILAERNALSYDTIEIVENRILLSIENQPQIWVDSIEELLEKMKNYY
jgi:iron complex transport system ATP-binding protein